jgi:hypothetical protein
LLIHQIDFVFFFLILRLMMSWQLQMQSSFQSAAHVANILRIEPTAHKKGERKNKKNQDGGGVFNTQNKPKQAAAAARERERNRDVVVITSEQLSVCVCWRRFKYFFLSRFFVYSFSDRKDFGRKIANWIYHSFKKTRDVVGFTWHCYFLSPHNCLKL